MSRNNEPKFSKSKTKFNENRPMSREIAARFGGGEFSQVIDRGRQDFQEMFYVFGGVVFAQAETDGSAGEVFLAA